MSGDGSMNFIKVGRGHDAQVRVTDISVSRFHAKIKKSTQGYFMVEDNGSKFGTLVLIRRPLLLKRNIKNMLQIGRTLVELTIKEPKNCCSKFCIPKQKTKNNQRQNKRNLVSIEGGYYFPEEFMPKNQYEFTQEDEQAVHNRQIQKALKSSEGGPPLRPAMSRRGRNRVAPLP